MLQADQQEVNYILETVDRIAKDTQFGSINLLDGSAGTNGVTNGAGLEFIGATEKSQSSGVNGYEVNITHASTRAEHVGAKPLASRSLTPASRSRSPRAARRPTSPPVRERRWSRH